MAWGIFILIVLLGSGNGLLHAMEQNMQGLALNIIRIYGGSTSLPYKGMKEGRAIELTNEDITLAESMKDHVQMAGGVLYSNNLTLRHGKETTSATANGVFEGYSAVDGSRIIHGRDLNRLDVTGRRKVVILHEKTVEMLFPQELKRAGGEMDGLLGQYVEIGGTPYRLVGIYRDNNFGSPSIYIPFTTLQTVFNRGNKIWQMVTETKELNTEEECEAFVDELRAQLAAKKQFDPTDKGALWFMDRFSNYLQQQKGENILREAIWFIGILTLLSGIVGVSNIMLITVKERTREFGIRKALGARPASILRLIIVESVIITAFFGYLGMVLGIAATEYLNVVAGAQDVDFGLGAQSIFLDPTVDLSVAIRATLTLIIAGTLAGFFPARKAVKIRPIEALRAE